MTEDQLQKSVATYLDAMGLEWCHVPNEGQRSPITGKRLKDKGMKSGVPDFLIFDRSGEYAGVAIELKVGKNKQTESQLDWQAKLVGRGWLYFVCRSLDEVIEIVNKHYNR